MKKTHFVAFVNNMAEAVDGKNLETQLKKVAFAAACTLTGPIGFEPSIDEHEGSYFPLS